MSPEAATSRYVVDPAQSRITLKVSAGGALAFLGHSPRIAARDYSGSLEVGPEGVAGSRVRVVVAANSLAVLDDMKAKDREEIESRTREEVLETDRYPEISFASDSVHVSSQNENRYVLQIGGTFLLHGVSQHETISAQVFFNGGTVRAVGEFRLKQSAYRIKPASALGGGLTVKDELVCTFDILAHREA